MVSLVKKRKPRADKGKKRKPYKSRSKKERKPRSDKGKKRKPYKSRAEKQSNPPNRIQSHPILHSEEMKVAEVIKPPDDFPVYRGYAMMGALFGSDEYLEETLQRFRRDQHTFFKVNSFKFGMMQGEYTAEGRKHIQFFVQATRTGSRVNSRDMWFTFKPPVSTQLSVKRSCVPVQAVHYTSKPHPGCNCDACGKARTCKPNWAVCQQYGEPPKGKGKGRFDAFTRSMKEDPSDHNMFRNHGELYIRYPSGCRGTQEYWSTEKIHDSIQNPRDVCNELRGWERDIDIGLFVWDYRDRKNIVWVWSTGLNTGKTTGMKHIKYVHGTRNCKKAGRSYKHLLYSYRGQTLIHFNFPDADPFVYETHSGMIESVCDQEIEEPDHYDGPTRMIQAHVIVTANVPPPEKWASATEGRIRYSVCLDPEPETELVQKTLSPYMEIMGCDMERVGGAEMDFLI